MKRKSKPLEPTRKQSQTLKTKRRIFRFGNYIDEYGPYMPGPHIWIDDVLKSRETDELPVFDPNDKEALSCVFNEEREEILDAKATLVVSISEWFPVACQGIRWAYDGELKEDISGIYKNNAATVLWPKRCCPLLGEVQGPAAFVAEIAIKGDQELLTEDRFKCVIAHELVHVFDMMKFVVPAFMNWRSFFKNFSGGFDGSDAGRRYKDISSFIDDYGQENERIMIAHYWPSQADKWFDAFRSDRAEKKKDN